MFIEDDELRALYQVSSAEHLETIESGLMHLEKHPDDGEKLNAVLRSMHSLKGDSRMLGVETAEKVVHQMEEMLIEVQQGQSKLTSGLCDRLYQGLDATQKIAAEAVTGEPANLNLFMVLAGLMSDVDSEGTPASSAANQLESSFSEEPIAQEELAALQEAEMLEQARLQFEHTVNQAGDDGDLMDAELDAFLGEALSSEEIVSESPAPVAYDSKDTVLQDLLADSPIEAPAPVTAVKADGTTQKADKEGQYQIDSIRVSSDKLDTLMNQADELTVTKLGLARRQDDLTDLYRLWEDWSRELSLLNVNGSTAEAMEQAFLRSTQERLSQIGEALVNVRHGVAEDMTRLNAVSQSLESGIRNLRLLPLSSIFNIFPRMVRDLSRNQGKSIDLVIEGGETLVDKRILEELKDPLTHLIRNAVDHGIETLNDRLAQGKPETATIRLRGFQMGDRIGLSLTDDGQGLNLQKIRQTAIRKGLYTEAELQSMSSEQIQNLIFAPGFSTKTTVTEISGRGVGLDVVRANIQKLKGTLDVESVPGEGCQFRLMINSNLASTQALIVRVEEETFALPLDAVETLLLLERGAFSTFDGQLTIRWQDQPTAVQWLSDILNLAGETPQSPPTSDQVDQKIPCVLMKINDTYLGLLVDEFIDQEQLVLKAKSQFLSQVPNVRGSAILGSGDICMVLEPADLMRSAQGETPLESNVQWSLPETVKPPILLVEDSVVIRTQMIRILSNAGFDVTAAVDGQDGLQKLRSGRYQAVVSDVEMPNMSGLEMTQAIRQDQAYNDLPIVLVTTLANADDKQRGADAGANAYLTKGDFDQNLLLETLRSLI